MMREGFKYGAMRSTANVPASSAALRMDDPPPRTRAAHGPPEAAEPRRGSSSSAGIRWPQLQVADGADTNLFLAQDSATFRRCARPRATFSF
eukprot:scaffold18474_cov107-Isochrysis_galbana.AAC.4